MLYDSHLDVFMKVAEAGSFSAAASDLYISPSAVIKQINLLETDLETRLFERTHRGLRLTKGGRILYEEAKELIRLSNRISDRVKGAAQEHGNVIRIGVSPLTPLDRIEELLREVRKNAPDIHYYMVPFENTQENAREILKNLGKRIDVVAGIFDEGLLAYRECLNNWHIHHADDGGGQLLICVSGCGWYSQRCPDPFSGVPAAVWNRQCFLDQTETTV